MGNKLSNLLVTTDDWQHYQESPMSHTRTGYVRHLQQDHEQQYYIRPPGSSRTLETLSPISYPRSQGQYYHSPRKQQIRSEYVQQQHTPKSNKKYINSNNYQQAQLQEQILNSDQKVEKQTSSRKIHQNQYTSQNKPEQNQWQIPDGQDYDTIFAKQLEQAFDIHTNSNTPQKGVKKTQNELLLQRDQMLQKCLTKEKSPIRNMDHQSPLQPHNFQRRNIEQKMDISPEQAHNYQQNKKVKQDQILPVLLDQGKEQYQNIRAVNQSIYNSQINIRQSQIKNYYFEKGELIGAGAFGRVYLGLDNNSGKLMAIKQVQIPQDPALRGKVGQQIQELQKEVSMLKKLKHKNIVQYLGTEKNDDYLNFYLEYVPGGSIASLIQKFGSFKESVIKVYSRQILQGLEYLHKNKIIHRDIKGANCLVDNQGTIKLADFGASKDIKSLATLDIDMNAKSLKGTPYWMAPEIIKQNGYGRQADIWSLGCTVFEMATGKPPFSEFNAPANASMAKEAIKLFPYKNQNVVLLKIACIPGCRIVGKALDQYYQYPAMLKVAEAEGPPSLPSQMSEYLKDFITQCMKKSPAKRPTCTELLNHPFLTKLTNPNVKINEKQKDNIHQRVDSGKNRNINNIPKPPVTPYKGESGRPAGSGEISNKQNQSQNKQQQPQLQGHTNKKVGSTYEQQQGLMQNKIDKILEQSHDQFLQVFNNALENQKISRQNNSQQTPPTGKVLQIMKQKSNQQWTNIPSTRANHVSTINHTSYNNRYASITQENSIDSYGSPPRSGSTCMPTQTDFGSETLFSNNYVNSQIAYQNSQINAKNQRNDKYSEVDSLSVQPRTLSRDQGSSQGDQGQQSINDQMQDPLDSYGLKNISNFANLNITNPSFDSDHESLEASAKKIKFGIQPKLSPLINKQKVVTNKKLQQHQQQKQAGNNQIENSHTHNNTLLDIQNKFSEGDLLENVEGTILPSALKPPKPKMNQDMHSPYGKKNAQRNKKVQNNQQQDQQQDTAKQGQQYQQQLDSYEQQVSEEVLLHYVDRKAKKDLVRLSQPFQTTLRDKLGLSQEDIDRYIQALQLDEDSPIEYTKEQLHQWRIKNKALSSEQCDLLQQYVQQQHKSIINRVQQQNQSPSNIEIWQNRQNFQYSNQSPSKQQRNLNYIDNQGFQMQKTHELAQNAQDVNQNLEKLTPKRLNHKKQPQQQTKPFIQTQPVQTTNQMILQKNQEHALQQPEQFQQQTISIQQNQRTNNQQQVKKVNSSTETTNSAGSLQVENTNQQKKGAQKNFIKANKESQGQRTKLQNKKLEKQKVPEQQQQQKQNPNKKR